MSDERWTLVWTDPVTVDGLRNAALSGPHLGHDKPAVELVPASVLADFERLKRHVNHAPILILVDGVYCAQCGGHVVEWEQE